MNKLPLPPPPTVFSSGNRNALDSLGFVVPLVIYLVGNTLHNVFCFYFSCIIVEALALVQNIPIDIIIATLFL